MECGVDFVLCELLWISVGVAFFPFVTITEGAEMSSGNDYDPMAQGICFLMWSQMTNDVVCSGGDWQYTWTGGTGSLSVGYTASGAHICLVGGECVDDLFAAIDMVENADSDSQFYLEQEAVTSLYDATAKGSSVSWMLDTNFYLNPIYFTMSVNHFFPTHNAVTSEPEKDNFQMFMSGSPFWKLFSTSGSYDSDRGLFAQNPQYLLFSVDKNDEFNQYPQTCAFAALIHTSWVGTFAGLWAYDVPLTGRGHNYDLHDLVLTIEWFSEAFRTWTLDGDASEVTLKIDPKYMDGKDAEVDFTVQPACFDGSCAVSHGKLIDGSDLGAIGSAPICYLNELNAFQVDGVEMSSGLQLPADPTHPFCSSMFGGKIRMSWDENALAGKVTAMKQVLNLFAAHPSVETIVLNVLAHAEQHGDMETYNENVHVSALYSCYLTNLLYPLIQGRKNKQYSAMKDGIYLDMDYVNTVCNDL